MNDITGSIQLPKFDGVFQQNDTKLIVPPKTLVDVTEVDKGEQSVKVANALLIVKEQMRLSGIRKVMIKEYVYTFNRLVEGMGIEYLDEITLEIIFNWLSQLGNISDVAKQSRLRTIKAVLNRFYDNSWLKRNFWKDVRIRVDTKIKLPANEKKLSILLSLLNMTNFIQFRDAVAVLT